MPTVFYLLFLCVAFIIAFFIGFVCKTTPKNIKTKKQKKIFKDNALLEFLYYDGSRKDDK